MAKKSRDFLESSLRRYYGRPEVAANYGRNTALHPPEAAILARLGPELRDRRLLDLGVGPGRTTGHVAPLSRRYVGLDYSANMLHLCWRRHPGVALVLGDSRELAFADASFDAVFYFYNGLDDADHADRLRALGEIRRVLRPGGWFVFSSHNLDWPRPSAFRPPRLIPPGEPGWLGQSAQLLLGYPRQILNHLRLRRREQHTAEYSMVNDPVEGYGFLAYFVSAAQETRQLEALGFGGVEVVDTRGATLPPGQECRDPWLYYLARKL